MDTTGAAATTGRDAILADLTRILDEITGDWETGFSGGIRPETKLIADLGFESIDVVHLVVTLEEHFRRQDLPFDRLLMKDGRYVDDLSVGDLADFLHGQIGAAS
jgi:acyl carrier protein